MELRIHYEHFLKKNCKLMRAVAFSFGMIWTSYFQFPLLHSGLIYEVKCYV